MIDTIIAIVTVAILIMTYKITDKIESLESRLYYVEYHCRNNE